MYSFKTINNIKPRPQKNIYCSQYWTIFIGFYRNGTAESGPREARNLRTGGPGRSTSQDTPHLLS